MPLTMLALHIPDGFLSLPVSLLGWVLALLLIGAALRQMRHELGERQVPLIGILAAFVFAAQMINFPIPGGTSGHLLGGTLVAVLLGPWPAVLVMTSVVSIQALLFQDGGLFALGFNLFNMGILSAFVGYGLYRNIFKLMGGSSLGRLTGAAVGAWAGVVLASAATALQLAASNTAPLALALPAMVGVHAVIGIGEALITVGALSFLHKTRPDLLAETAPDTRRGANVLAAGLLVALVIACLSPLASSNPDGLEQVAETQGFSEQAETAPYELLPDYTTPWITNPALTTAVSGVVGVLVVAGAALTIARLNKRRDEAEG